MNLFVGMTEAGGVARELLGSVESRTCTKKRLSHVVFRVKILQVDGSCVCVGVSTLGSRCSSRKTQVPRGSTTLEKVA